MPDVVARSARTLAGAPKRETADLAAEVVAGFLNSLTTTCTTRPTGQRPKRRAEAATAEMLAAHAAQVLADVPPVGDLSNLETSAVEQHPPFCAYAPGCGRTHNSQWVDVPATGRDGVVFDHAVAFPVVHVAAEWETYEDAIGGDVHDGRALLHLAASWPSRMDTRLRFTPEEWREAAGAIESAHGIATADPRWEIKPGKDGGLWNDELHPFWCPEVDATGCGAHASVFEYLPASGDGWKPGGGGVVMPALAVAAEATNEDGIARVGVQLHFPGPDRAVSLTPTETVRLLAAAHRALTTLSDYEGGRS